ncbi:sterol homeostasis protein [Basidiobolus ranarum]|uniref:Protein ARV n=1 Tax=Basidiobolus ranarum TaxID=34480 RepID=A0ABR2WZ22_9FUNG
MPTCVECGTPVSTLYMEYSKGNIRLTQCENCKNFVDKYVEHDAVIIFIDLLLFKPQVYRHILFNRLDYKDQGIHPSVLKLGILLILFDVYIKWFKLERYYAKTKFPFGDQPLYLQYIYILALCLIEFLAYQFGVRLAVSFCLGSKYAIIKYNYVSMALIISSFGKLLLILMVIWDYNELEYSWLLSVFVFASNLEALSVFLDFGYLRTTLVMLCGLVIKLMAQMIYIQLTNSTLMTILLTI